MPWFALCKLGMVIRLIPLASGAATYTNKKMCGLCFPWSLFFPGDEFHSGEGGIQCIKIGGDFPPPPEAFPLSLSP